MTNSEGYVSADYLKKVAEIGKHIKQSSYDRMAMQAGHVVLDVGCGPGIDTVAMAITSSMDSKIYGIDIDQVMLDEADARAREYNVADKVSHQLADVCELPFENEMFDAVRAERLLQVLPDFLQPHETLRELLRVLKPGGRLVVIDTDWASASVDIPNVELERRMMSFFMRYMRPNGVAGRQLYGLFGHNNIEDVSLEVFPLVQHDFAKTPFGEWLQKESVASGLVSETEADYWYEELSMLDKLGEFYSCVNVVMMAGSKKW